jgi:hypothetical protein
MLTISPSKIQAADCPHYFRQQYLVEDPGARKTEGPETPLNLLEGRFDHAAIDLYTRALVARKAEADHLLFDAIFEELWKRVVYMPNSLHDEVNDSLKPFVEGYTVDRDTLWASEKKIALNWQLEEVEWEAEDAWLRAVLDRVNVYSGDATAEITDYKSQRYIPSEAKLQKALQSKIYPFVLHKINPYFERFIVTYHYIRWNKKVKVTFDIGHDFKKIERELREFTERMMEKIANPEAEWPAIRCENCGICRYDCPLVDLGLGPVRTNPRAVEVAMQIEAMTAKLKSLKTELQGYVKQTDDKVEIHSGSWEYHPIDILRGIKVEDIVAYCKERKIPFDQLLAFDAEKFKKTAGPQTKADVQALGKMSTQSRFTFVKTAKTDDGEEE